ncbi:hypothetical protein [Dyella caseinilytica]|uniref:Uncharacterized protein n=1 Tax=Dyella caseinilytica TaxID=1849581 RepID=A0ABX7GRB9_9GAMM|nr:hypothetical protein [Dyella caseinilytica]QRN52606.1 hypothetical protein ISN74_14170 [Dyella caseinilytica]GGA07337.1 hypothetical protein GCM10011408_30630 [Dyella caseinilytica]
MMLPFRRRPNAPKQSPYTPAAEVRRPEPGVPELGPRHLDYDLHPLNVESLSHYIEPVADEERFRVY